MPLILKTFCHLIMQVTLLLSVLFLLRGHNHPGGGFIGALVACAGAGFHILVYLSPLKFITHRHLAIINLGLVCLFCSIFAALLTGKSLLTGLWISLSIFGVDIKLGTPLLFDVGVYFSIMGSLLWIMSSLEKDFHD